MPMKTSFGDLTTFYVHTGRRRCARVESKVDSACLSRDFRNRSTWQDPTFRIYPLTSSRQVKFFLAKSSLWHLRNTLCTGQAHSQLLHEPNYEMPPILNDCWESPYLLSPLLSGRASSNTLYGDRPLSKKPLLALEPNPGQWFLMFLIFENSRHWQSQIPTGPTHFHRRRLHFLTPFCVTSAHSKRSVIGEATPVIPFFSSGIWDLIFLTCTPWVYLRATL